MKKSLKALIVVDVQNDFLPGGALPVKEGDKIIPLINQLLDQDFDVKIATKDWHPKNHLSFAVNHGKQPGETVMINGKEQILWPVHCVQDTAGAAFPTTLNADKVERIFYKGVDKTIDGYSTFYDSGDDRSTGLAEYLKKKNVTEVYVVGLATDYCVKFSVLDAAKLGFHTFVITDACRAINLHPNDEERSLQEMRQAGAHPIIFSAVKRQ